MEKILRYFLLFLLIVSIIGLKTPLFTYAVTVNQEVFQDTPTETGGGGLVVPPLAPKPVVPPPVIERPPVVPPEEVGVVPEEDEFIIPPLEDPFIPPSIPSSPEVPSGPSGVSAVFPSVSVGGFTFQNIGNQIRNISEKILVGAGEFIKSPVGNVVTGISKPLGVVAGVGVIAVQTIITTATMTVGSLSDIYLMAWRLLGLLFGAKKRKGKSWGTVYDSITKRPLDPAYVVIKKESGEEISDAITDLDGRYGFLVPSGTYKLKASKTNYIFPSKKLEGVFTDELYENIYHEELVTTKEGEVIVRNIPLDPIGFDWNEFEKNKKNLFRIYSDRERVWLRFFDVLYFIGFLSAIITTLFDQRLINFVFLGLYFIFVVYSFSGSSIKKATSVKYINGLEPIPYAIIKVFFAGVDNQAKTVVSDHLGRFYFLVGPGKYYLTVSKKQSDGSYVQIHKTDTMDLPSGFLNKDILI